MTDVTVEQATVQQEVPAVIICDNKDGCTEPATFAYFWEWGESGHCCNHHRFLLEQTARNIKRKISFTALNPNQTKPLTRDERVRLTSERLVAYEERDEALERGRKLSSDNSDLARQVQRLVLIDRENKAQLQQANARAVAAEQRARELELTLGEQTQELERLRLAFQSLPELADGEDDVSLDPS